MTNWAGKTPTADEWRDIMEKHAKWYRGEAAGCRADLSGAYLTRADLGGANLTGANLSGAYLTRADLSRANLSGADLSRAYLTLADLTLANLTGANLSRADLSRANLSGANLSGAYLSRAYLSGADLSRADLSRLVALRRICPESGAFTAYKKLQGGAIAELLIPADAARVGGLIGRKCRAAFADVVAIHGTETGTSNHDPSFVYAVGQRVTPREPFNDDVRIECASGIHFFMSRMEALDYQG